MNYAAVEEAVAESERKDINYKRAIFGVFLPRERTRERPHYRPLF